MRVEMVWVLPAVLAAVDWWAVARGDRRTETWAKPGTLVALLVTALALGAADSTPGRWLLVALVFGLLGDIALLGDSLGRFRAGLTAFLVGHLAYLVCFATLGLPAPAGRGPCCWCSWPPSSPPARSSRRPTASTARPSPSRWPSTPPPSPRCSSAPGSPASGWSPSAPPSSSSATPPCPSTASCAPSPAHLIVMVTYHVGQALIVAGVLAATT